MSLVTYLLLAMSYMMAMAIPVYFCDHMLTRRYSRRATVIIWIVTFLATAAAITLVIWTTDHMIVGGWQFSEDPLSLSLAIWTYIIVTFIVFSLAYKGPRVSAIFVLAFYNTVTLFVSMIICDLITSGICYVFGIESNADNALLFNIIEIILIVAICIPVLSRATPSVKAFVNVVGGSLVKYTAITVTILFLSVLNNTLWNWVDDALMALCIVNSITFMFLFIAVYSLILRDVSEEVRKVKESSELKTAAELQTSILPPADSLKDITNVEVAASMEAAKAVGGDFYDLFQIDDAHVAFLVADVSDKGIPAAMFMMRSRTVIRSTAASTSSPSEAVTKSNRTLMEENEGSMFVTAFLGVLNITNGEFAYCNAGHNPPFVRRGSEVSLLTDRNGPFMGISDCRYTEGMITLAPGDGVLMYTDGASEAEDPDGDFLGMDRIAQCFRYATCSADAVDSVIEAVRDFTGGSLTDDTTLLSFRFLRPVMVGSFYAEDAYMSDAVEWVSDGLADAIGEVLPRAEIIAEEVFLNIAHNAYPGGGGSMSITIDTGGGGAILTFRDTGIPFDPLGRVDRAVLPIDLQDEGGNGIRLIRKLSDGASYAYRRGMNILTITLTRDFGAEPSDKEGPTPLLVTQQ